MKMLIPSVNDSKSLSVTLSTILFLALAVDLEFDVSFLSDVFSTDSSSLSSKSLLILVLRFFKTGLLGA